MPDNIKVFRLHEGDNGTGWFNSSPFSSVQLETIRTQSNEVPTSIPSPFAQIDLVKSAFKWLSDEGNELEGNTGHHKLVSYALDVAQLFFAIDKYKDKLKIVAWNPTERFEKLIENSASNKHKNLAKTLDLYWEQDSVKGDNLDKLLYNFEKTIKLFFLLNEDNELIGSTSPISLFAPAPDIVKVTKDLNIRIGTHQLFDDEYASLAKRNLDFIEYLFTLSKQENFGSYFNEFNSYLLRVKEVLPAELKTRVSGLSRNDIDNFPELSVLDADDDPCDVIGYKLKKNKKKADTAISSESHFVIKPDFELTETLPLVLPHDKFSRKWIFTTEGIYWDEKYKVPYKNTCDPVEESVLPVLNDIYPWYSTGNFLEDKLFKLPYNIDTKSFFVSDGKQYLLPLTDIFFTYFDVGKIDEYVKIEPLSAGVRVKLILPVNNGNISLSKIYNREDIIDLDIHLAVLPFVKLKKDKLDYTVSVLDDRISKSKQIQLLFFNKGKIIKGYTESDGKDVKEINNNTVVRNHDETDTSSLSYKITRSNFDVLQLIINNQKATIIPNLPTKSGNAQMNFAMDFGTTNTHIEYNIEGKGEGAKGFDSNGEIWKSLFDQNNNDEAIPKIKDNELLFEKQLIPLSLGGNKVKFPLRTALVWNKDLDVIKGIEIFQHSNNYLLLGIKESDPDFQLFKDIKWSKQADANKVKSYISYLVHLAYYKTILNGGDPNKTKITWFYPVSMGETELDNLKAAWKKAFVKLFGEVRKNSRLLSFPESIAPYFAYKASISGLSLSVDIGGGSADIAVFDESKKTPFFISSCRFAGNAMYGDAYSNPENAIDTDSSGLVKAFKSEGESAAKAANIDKERIFDSIINNSQHSKEFINFMFQLEKDPSLNFSFTDLLRADRKYKINVFIYFTALAYYSAVLMKKEKLNVPKNLLFSGMASNSVHILDASDQLNSIAGMFKFVFEKVYDKELTQDIKVFMSDNPKQITAKGGLRVKVADTSENPIVFWVGDNGNLLNKEKDVANTPTYQNIIDNDNAIKDEIVENVTSYFTILDEYVNSVRLEDKYNLSREAYTVFERIREEHLADDIEKGINGFYNKADSKLVETLFFYPIIGILNRLSNELFNE